MAKLSLLVSTLLTLLFIPFTTAWLPKHPIRGVNLGGLFIIEPWMQWREWRDMGCDGLKSEFDCVMRLGQEKANAAFKKHWETWITEDDFKKMVSYGINTVRIPVGYWMLEDLVYRDSEHFAQGSFQHLERICGLAKKYNLYVILDLHGAPAAQIPRNAFTGQFAPAAGFYAQHQYRRAVTFLGWLARKAHQVPALSNVGMIQVLNEPLAWSQSTTASMIKDFYPWAYKHIRETEDKIGHTDEAQRLHVQFMDENWGAGNPNQYLPADRKHVAYDYHKYVKWDTSVTANRESYMRYSCNAGLGVEGQQPLIVGEWSLSVPDHLQESEMFKTSGSTAVQWFQQWFIAQQQMYEKHGIGWVFWNWRAELDDWRWSYRDAVNAGVIPKNLGESLSRNVCGQYRKREVLTETVQIAADVVERAEGEPKPSSDADFVKRGLSRFRSHRKRHAHAHVSGPSS